VLVAALTGDGLVLPDDKESLISQACLDNVNLSDCQAYQAAVEADKKGCPEDPGKLGCEQFYHTKLACIRECYVSAKGDAANSYVCLSQYGKADFGSRYVHLAGMFGRSGLTANLCSPDGLTGAMDSLAKLVIRRVAKICLPAALAPGEHVLVQVTPPATEGTAGQPVSLIEGPPPDGDFEVIYPESDCCFRNEAGQCTGSQTAITFSEPMDKQSKFLVTYKPAPLGE
jgi:hypothetical protein